MFLKKKNNLSFNLKKNIKFNKEICTNYIKNKILVELNQNNEVYIKLKKLLLSSFVTYCRRYFKFKDIRMTIDKRIFSKRLYKADKFYYKKNLFPERKFKILEIKYHDNSHEEVRKMTNKFIFKIDKFSKYCFSINNN